MVFVRFVHGETESLCAEIISLKDIARGRRGELISRRELIMYYSAAWRLKEEVEVRELYYFK